MKGKPLKERVLSYFLFFSFYSITTFFSCSFQFLVPNIIFLSSLSPYVMCFCAILNLLLAIWILNPNCVYNLSLIWNASHCLMQYFLSLTEWLYLSSSLCCKASYSATRMNVENIYVKSQNLKSYGDIQNSGTNKLVQIFETKMKVSWMHDLCILIRLFEVSTLVLAVWVPKIPIIDNSKWTVRCSIIK